MPYDRQSLEQSLFAMRDEKYKSFQAPLIPSVESERIIGVRTPHLRAFAKNFAKTDAAAGFLSDLPHYYYDENNLHAFMIETIRDFDSLISALDAFLPFVDNWATCDLMRPPAFKCAANRLLPVIDRYLASTHTYTVRFGIELLMTHFLDDNFSGDILRRVASVQSDEYYINMMCTWFFATALAKHFDETLPYIETHALSPDVHNKTIQKSVESRRLTTEEKNFLKSMRIK